MKNHLLRFCWFLSGVCYVFGYYVLSALGCAWIASRGITSNLPQILLSILMFFGIALFFVITHFFGKKTAELRSFFPIGVFLAADTVLAVILTQDMLNGEKLIARAGGKENIWLAQSYAKCGFVLILGLVMLVVSFLISVLLRQFKKFQAMAAAYEAQTKGSATLAPTQSDAPTTADTPSAQPSPTDEPTKDTSSEPPTSQE